MEEEREETLIQMGDLDPNHFFDASAESFYLDSASYNTQFADCSSDVPHSHLRTNLRRRFLLSGGDRSGVSEIGESSTDTKGGFWESDESRAGKFRPEGSGIRIFSGQTDELIEEDGEISSFASPRGSGNGESKVGFGKRKQISGFSNRIVDESENVDGEGFSRVLIHKNKTMHLPTEKFSRVSSSIEAKRSEESPIGISDWLRTTEDAISQIGEDTVTSGTIAFPIDSSNGTRMNNLLLFLAAFVVKAIGFQINLCFMFFTFPIKLLVCSIRVVTNPLSTINHVKEFVLGLFGRTIDYSLEKVGGVFSFQSPMAGLAKRFGWGVVWSCCVGFLLVALLVSSFLASGLFMRMVLEEPIQMKEMLHFDYTMDNPAAYMPIESCEGVFCIRECWKKDGVIRNVDRRLVPPYHKLQLTMSLTMPESDYNRNLGVFQVKAEFLSTEGKVLASSSQPCMLRFKSHLIVFAETFLRGIPLLAGYSSQSQILKIRMTGLTEGVQPSACIRILLERRAGFRAGQGIPEIYSASLLLESKLPMFKKLMWNWKLTLFIWFSMSFFIVQLCLILICFRHAIFPSPRLANVMAQEHEN